MEFRILGPLEVRVGDRVLPLGGPKRRALLAVLLLNPCRVVSMDRLIDALWGEAPPSTATVQVQGHVSALRKVLTAETAADHVILTRPPGYLIRVEPEQLDLEVFERRASEGGRALSEGRPGHAAAEFRAALELWRGPALGGMPAPYVETEAARLAERWLAVMEQRIEADLALGRHADLVSELAPLVAERPLREGLRAQLMLALYRDGRQADALAAYRQGRRVLAEELGLDPGPELQRLQQAILAADPDLELDPSSAPPVTTPAPPAATPGAARTAPSPAQLPPDIADFAGRDKQVGRVCSLLTSAAEAAAGTAAGAVSAIAGKAGVGKTTLAVHAAHRLRDSFPDGQLYVNLRGAEPKPLEAAEALGRFLRALGIAGVGIPEDAAGRGRLYRSLLAERRMVVVLDNAGSEGQVRPLLPGTPGCGVLVTSRSRLAGLEGADVVDLDVLDPGQGVELLAGVVGRERVAAEPEAAEEVARLCGYLPLAVRVAGARLAARAHWGLRRLVARLSDERQLLDELRAGDLEVRASLALSYGGLGSDQKRAFRRLGLLDAPDFAAWAAAAVLDVPPERSAELVDSLVDAQLLDVSGHGPAGRARYRFHDLIRVYARERATADEPPSARQAALARALGGSLALAYQADQRLVSNAFGVVLGASPRWRPDPLTVDRLVADPLAWFEAERPAMVAAVGQARAEGLDELACGLTGALAPFFAVRGYYDDWRHTLEVALAAARRAGNRRDEAAKLRGLGELSLLQERLDDALACFHQAEKAFHAAGDSHGVAIVTSGAGAAQTEAGRFEEAEAYLEQALTGLRTAGDPSSEAWTLRRLGILRRWQGRYELAAARFHQALGVLGGLGEPLAESAVLEALGDVRTLQGHRREARASLDRSLALRREHGDYLGEARALAGLGELHLTEGRHDQAACCLRESLRLWKQLGLPVRHARVLSRLGAVHQARGNQEAAQAAREKARRLYGDLGIPEDGELTALPGQ